MSDKAEYKIKLCELEDLVLPDDLVQGEVETGGIYVDGAGKYKRGELLMSNSAKYFVKATESGMSTADELCILSEDLELDDDTIAQSVGYFFGAYNQNRIILPEGMTMTYEVSCILRKHGIYVK